MPKKIIYLDNHATTPVDPRVLKAMLPYFSQKFGNAASRTHDLGREAEKAVESARHEVASLIHADAREIIFTGGATESNNLALKGVAEVCRDKGNHIVTVGTEHKSVLDPCRRLEAQGFSVTYLGVDGEGLLNVEELKKALTPKTILISVMLANNEIGVIQPVAEIGRVAKERGILFHCDAVQALGRISVNVKALGIDFASFSAHKNYGPKGVGALYLRKSEPRPRLLPLLEGGAQEGGFRSGTLNVPGIVGFGKACRISQSEMPTEAKRLSKLRDRLRNGLLAKVNGARVNGSESQRLPHNLNMSFPGVPAGKLISKLKNLAISSGSACLSTSTEPSYVLKALGLPEELRRCSLRFGLGRFTTEKEIDQTTIHISNIYNELNKVGHV